MTRALKSKNIFSVDSFSFLPKKKKKKKKKFSVDSSNLYSSVVLHPPLKPRPFFLEETVLTIM